MIATTRRPAFFEVLARAELARGRLREADQAASRGEAIAGGLELHLATSWAQRARAQVLLAEHKPLDAAELALASAAAAGAVGARIEAARARALAGHALLLAGEREQGDAELQTAAAQFDSCGATRRGAKVERELRRLGQRFQRRREHGDTGLGGLSACELEIVELVAAQDQSRDRRRAVPEREDGLRRTCATSSASSASPHDERSRRRWG